MKWEDRQESSNVEDKREESGGFSGGTGGVRNVSFLIPIIKTLLGTKFGWLLLLVGGFLYFSGIIDPFQLIAPTQQQISKPINKELDDQHAKFMATVLGDTEKVWQEVFQKLYGKAYMPPKLVLFRGQVQSGCGFAQAQMGPFYCPVDKKVYIDLDFLDALVKGHGGGGDFAEAYVLAHEVGHHIQNLQGTLEKVQRYNAKAASESDQNALQVRVELQADCYAGIWAHVAQKNYAILEKGDIEEALNTASAIGDDILQKKAQGYVVPDSFTHGTAKQRVAWFKKGFETGSVEMCDTFR